MACNQTRVVLSKRESIIQYYTVYILYNHIFLPHVDKTPFNKDIHGNQLGSRKSSIRKTSLPFCSSIYVGFYIPTMSLQAPPLHLSTIRTSCINRSAILCQRTIHQCIITSLIYACRLSAVLIETHHSTIPSTSGIKLHPSTEKEITASRAEALHPQSHHHQRLDTIMGGIISRHMLHGSIHLLGE